MAKVIKNKKIQKNLKTIKLDSRTHTKDAFLLSFCKWEFMRRNKQYQEDFDKYSRGITEEEADEMIDLIPKKWGINGLKDYRHSITVAEAKNLSYKNDEDIEVIPSSYTESVKTLTPQIVNVSNSKTGGYVPVVSTKGGHYILGEKAYNIDRIELEVNLLTHKKTLLKDFENIIDSWQAFNKKHGNLKVSSMRIEDWEKYWKIYDLKKENPKVTFGELAMKLNGTKSFRRDEEDKLSKAYKKCCELIEGGYRNINL